MNLQTCSLFFLLVACLSCGSTRMVSTTELPEQTRGISYAVDLGDYADDVLQVRMDCSRLGVLKTEFRMPAIVPGIYGKMNFGKWVTDVEASDINGDVAQVQRLDSNRWHISAAATLEEIRYTVNDGWEVFDFDMKESFYRSASSSFSPDHMVINQNSLFGYLPTYTELPIRVYLDHPKRWYPATSADKQSLSPGSTVLETDDYHALVDAPILLAEPDTAQIILKDIQVEVACFSTTRKKIAHTVAQYIRPLLENQRAYLGGSLPVNHYSFLIYHHDPDMPNSYMGDGLEHSYSTLILLAMPLDLDVIQENVYGIASHEFFHIVMPLGIHSHEIADYDFDAPSMSQHLWLYEGTTEYFAIHMPLARDVYDWDAFLAEVRRKLEMMADFDNSLSMTELSKQAMERQDQYYNVYLRGTLINLCMDIELRSLSQGKMGMQPIILELLDRYGPERSFDDDALFDEIIAISGQPELRQFIDAYIIGSQPLPIANYLQQAGIHYDPASGALRLLEEISAEQERLRGWWRYGAE